jgi:hypothetical protein
MRESHEDVARIALSATAGRYEVALGGGNALHVHGVSYRPTEDIDLFCRREMQVRPAADAIADALETKGYSRQAEDREDEEDGEDKGPGDLVDWWPDLGEGLVDMVVRVPGTSELVQVQAAHFEFGPAVESDLGPVLALDDVAAWKAHAAINRGAPRDLVDIAALLRHGYSIEQLLALVRQKDPGTHPEDIADVGRRLDKMRDRRLEEHIEGSGLDPASIRALFKEWPRKAPYLPDQG